MSGQEILIDGLKVKTHIGVPDEEQIEFQTLWVDLKLGIETPFGQMEDEISATVDYAAVADAVKQVAAARIRRLIETLAWDIRDCLVQRFNVTAGEIIVRKKILPETNWVAVKTLIQPGRSK